jgi:hypothetical protein
LPLGIRDSHLLSHFAPQIDRLKPNAGAVELELVAPGGFPASRLAGRFRIFRYEVRRWRDGVIPDVAEAVASPQQLSDDPGQAQRLLDLVPRVPTPVWGRDELEAGEMWNSNPLISWLIVRSGLNTEMIRPPVRGRPRRAQGAE